MMLINTKMKIEMALILLFPSFFLSVFRLSPSVDQWWLIQLDGNNSSVSQLIGYLQSKLAKLTINNFILLLFWDERRVRKPNRLCFSHSRGCKMFWLVQKLWNTVTTSLNFFFLYHIIFFSSCDNRIYHVYLLFTYSWSFFPYSEMYKYITLLSWRRHSLSRHKMSIK